jgi:hypothetical protein
MNRLVLSLCIMAIAVAPTLAQENNPDERELGNTEGLEKSRSGFRETWVNPDADFNQYSKIYLWGAIFEYRDVGPAQANRSSFNRSNQREFGIAAEDRVAFEETVSQIFLEELQKLKTLEITQEIGPDTMIMRGGFLDIVSRVPPESVGRVDVYMATFGEATFIVELIDAETGDVLAVASERRKIEQPGGRIDQFTMRTTSVTVQAEVRRWAQRAAAKLRSEIDKGMNKARKN